MFNWQFEQMVLTDVNDKDREVGVEYTVDPGQPGNYPIFDKSGDLVDPGEPEVPPMVDDVRVVENGVNVSDEFNYNWDRVLL